MYPYPDNITVALTVGSPSINLIGAVLENGVLNISPGFFRIKLVEAYSEMAPEVTIPQELILGIRAQTSKFIPQKRPRLSRRKSIW